MQWSGTPAGLTTGGEDGDAGEPGDDCGVGSASPPLGSVGA